MATAEGALEGCATVTKACLSKLTHCEQRLMFTALRGHEFVRLYMQSVSDYDERMDPSWLKRQTGDLMGAFFEAK